MHAACSPNTTTVRWEIALQGRLSHDFATERRLLRCFDVRFLARCHVNHIQVGKLKSVKHKLSSKESLMWRRIKTTCQPSLSRSTLGQSSLKSNSQARLVAFQQQSSSNEESNDHVSTGRLFKAVFCGKTVLSQSATIV